MNITKLSLFDFDSTLFRSPDRPGWWDDETNGYFFGSLVSLSEPIVPKQPGSQWWVEEVVHFARASLLHPNSYTVLATGRREQFRDRVTHLALQQWLDFDEIHLNPGTETGYYKGTLLFRLIHRFPNLEEVEIWDDREDLLSAYYDIATTAGFTTKAHIIRVKPMPVKASSEMSFRIARRYFQQKSL